MVCLIFVIHRQMETPDVEIWEGEVRELMFSLIFAMQMVMVCLIFLCDASIKQGVLANPLPDPTDPMSHVFFRYPRNFLGTIYCKLRLQSLSFAFSNHCSA